MNRRTVILIVNLQHKSPKKMFSSSRFVSKLSRHVLSSNRNVLCFSRRPQKSPDFTAFTLNPTVRSWRSSHQQHVRERKKVTELANLIKLASTEKYRLAGAVGLLLISSSVTMAIPYCFGRMIDMLSLPPDELKIKLVSSCQILLFVFAVGALANFGRVYLINLSSYRITNNLRNKAYRSILDQEIAFFDKTKTGELINRLSSDASVIGLSVTNNISDGLRSAFSFVAGSSLMIYTSPHLALIALMTVSPVALVAVIYGKYLKKITAKVQTALASSTEVAEERISNIRTVHAFAKQDKEKWEYNERIKKVLNFAEKESLARAVFFGMSGFSGNLIALTVLFSGGFMMTDNAITIGSLSSFLMYAAYVGISIGGMSTFYAELMRGLGASTRLWQIVNRIPEISLKSGTIPSKLTGNLQFEHINFSYPNRPDVQVLSDFVMNIPSGSVYAIVGPSGSGKSTIGSLLLRFYDCDSGSVMLDGEDIRTFDLQWLRKNIGIVSQEPTLFSCSIKENILYGGAKEDASKELIEKAAKDANAFEFISKFPDGMDTLVGERGVMLSGGQRQRIAIARALLKDPKILILDEATSALDAESEHLVQSALENLMKGRTVITIAHRLSTIRKADRIAVLDNGRIIEDGTYEELLSNKDLFYRFVQHQIFRS